MDTVALCKVPSCLRQADAVTRSHAHANQSMPANPTTHRFWTWFCDANARTRAPTRAGVRRCRRASFCIHRRRRRHTHSRRSRMTNNISPKTALKQRPLDKSEQDKCQIRTYAKCSGRYWRTFGSCTNYTLFSQLQVGKQIVGVPLANRSKTRKLYFSRVHKT